MENGYNIKCILNTYPEDFDEKRKRYPDLWFSCGIHPWFADKSESRLISLQRQLKDPKIVAIGEIGLDKLKGPDIKEQIYIFRKQIELAIIEKKPIIIHCVKAWEELISLYKEYKHHVPWIIHGYRGNPDQTKQLVKIGFKFSFGKKFNNLSIKNIPLDSIFCETDTSDVTICKVYENISDELGLNINHFATLAEENIKNTFQKLTYL